MTAVVAASTVVVLGALAVVGFGPDLAAAWRRRRDRARSAPRRSAPVWDPGRELRAERRARELMREVVSPREYAMYRELGFIAVEGTVGDGYGYLLYPHRPIIAFDLETRELLSEYCVAFPDRSDPEYGHRLPDADDVLAKWMSIRGGERELIGVANMRQPGWQVDPDQVRRDLASLARWQATPRREVAA